MRKLLLRQLRVSFDMQYCCPPRKVNFPLFFNWFSATKVMWYFVARQQWGWSLFTCDFGKRACARGKQGGSAWILRLLRLGAFFPLVPRSFSLLLHSSGLFGQSVLGFPDENNLFSLYVPFETIKIRIIFPSDHHVAFIGSPVIFAPETSRDRTSLNRVCATIFFAPVIVGL